MSWMRGHQVARLAERAIAAYGQERDRLQEANLELSGQVQALDAKIAQAWEQLTVTLVPGLERQHLDWVANLLHLPSVAAEAVHQRIADERRDLQARLDGILGDPAYVEREGRLNACAIEIAELERSLEPLEASLDVLESLPLFTLLIAAGYDTDAYPHKFWELIYYRHWKHGDLAVERWGEPRGLKRFAEVRGRYLQEAEARSTLRSELASIVARRAEVETLITRHDNLQAALANLEDRHWAQTRARVHEHLAELVDDIPKLLAAYEPGLYAAKRVLGMLAKRRYFDALRETWIDEPLHAVERKLAKAKRGATKYRRAKHANRNFPGDEMERKYQVPRAGWDKRWRKWDTTYALIVNYDRYDEFDLHGDSIWWHEMTGGRSKARFIPEVREYYERRQFAQAVNERSWADDDARDDAIAALAEDGVGPGAEINDGSWDGSRDGSWDDDS